MAHTDISPTTPSIGVFDSGFGGLTVLQQLINVLPKESYTYFGDTARLPYGEKSGETIIRYSIENAMFLLEKNIKTLVVACSTASSYAIERLQQTFNIPIIGVIDPTAAAVVKASPNRRIAVLGTKATIHSQSYQKSISRLAPDAYILPIACPLFVPLVEEHYVDHPAARLIVQEYLKPIRENHIDTVLLGCTHYPLLKHLIQNELGEDIHIIDSARSCAEEVSRVLNEHQLHVTGNSTSCMNYFVSDDPHKFQKLGKTLFNLSIDHVSLKI